MIKGMMKPDKEQEEGNETVVGSALKESNISTLPQYSHQYANKSCDVGSLTIQSLRTGNHDTSPEKRILSPSLENTLKPNKLRRYSYMDNTSTSRRLPSCDTLDESDVYLESVGNTLPGMSPIESFNSCGDIKPNISQTQDSIVDDQICPIESDLNVLKDQQEITDYECKRETSTNLTFPSCREHKHCINELPRSLLVQIFSALSMRDILTRAAYVCKMWYNISKDPDLWRHIRLEDSNGYLRITDSILDRVTSLSNNISSILLADCNLVTDSGLSSVLCKCSNLRALHILRCSRLTDRSYTCIADHCHRLKMLNLSGSSGLTDVGLQKIACNCQQLEQIQLNQCTKITDKSTQVIAIKCTRIKCITFQENEGVTDASVETLSSHCKSLQSLTIHKCSLSANGIFNLSKIPTLTNIDISNNKYVTPSAVKYFVDHCKQLESLNLCLCHSIDDDCIKHIAIYAKEIRKLLLVGCQITDQALLNLGKYAFNLMHVDVGWCEEITDEGVISISTMCHKLNYLGLMRCDKVSDKTTLELAKQNSHIVYSTFLLDSQRLIAQATQQGFVFQLDEED